MQLIGITRETKLGHQYDQKRDVGLEVANLTRQAEPPPVQQETHPAEHTLCLSACACAAITGKCILEHPNLPGLVWFGTADHELKPSLLWHNTDLALSPE